MVLPQVLPDTPLLGSIAGQTQLQPPLAASSLWHCCCALCSATLVPPHQPPAMPHPGSVLTWNLFLQPTNPTHDSVPCPRGHGEQLITVPISQAGHTEVVMVLPFQKEQIHFSTSLLSQPHTDSCKCPPVPETFSSSSCYPGLSPQLPLSHLKSSAINASCSNSPAVPRQMP